MQFLRYGACFDKSLVKLGEAVEPAHAYPQLKIFWCKRCPQNKRMAREQEEKQKL